jgi:hypothetical protein
VAKEILPVGNEKNNSWMTVDERGFIIQLDQEEEKSVKINKQFHYSNTVYFKKNLCEERALSLIVDTYAEHNTKFLCCKPCTKADSAEQSCLWPYHNKL